MSTNIYTSTLFRLAFLSLLITVLVLNVDLSKITVSIFSSYLVAMSWTFLPLIGSVIVLTLRHAALLHRYSPPYKYVLSAVLLAAGLNYIFPSRLPELLKASYLREKCAVPFSAGASAVIMERLIDVILIGVISIICIAFIPDINSKWMYISITILFISLLIALPRLDAIIHYTASKIPWPNVTRFLNQLYKELKDKTNLKLIYTNVMLGIIIWTFNVAAFYIFLNIALADGLSLLGVLTVFIAATIGIAIPILPGGLGTFEAAIVLSLQAYGYDIAASLPVAIMLRVTLMLTVTPAALILTVRSGTGARSLLTQARRAIKAKN